ncbi:MAG: serine hydrolase [Bdellovibrionales bacterium]|nr:serine hydrolase [Oligoflexia bacterium]
MQPLEKIKNIFEKYTTSYHFYLRDLRTGEEFELGTKKKYPICSCFKLAVLMAVFEELNDKADLNHSIVIDPEEFSPGGGAIGYFDSAVTFTTYQLMQLMMSFSDSTATDYLIRSVGIEKVNARLSTHCGDSETKLEVGEMVKLFQANLRKDESRPTSLSDAGKVLIEKGSYSNATDLAALALASYNYKAKPMFHEIYNSILRSKKFTPRTDLFYSEKVKFVGKTGSIGFGYYLNDCGVLELNGEPIAVLAYTSEGWPLVRELNELFAAKVGLNVSYLLGLHIENERWNLESAEFLE